MPARILHIGDNGFFAASLFEYLQANGLDAGHRMLGHTRQPPWPAPVAGHVRRLGRLRLMREIAREGRRADKIIVHSLLQKYVLVLLWLRPALLAKACWIMWGHDLYFHRQAKASLRNRLQEWLRRRVIPRFAQVASATPGDGELLRRWYGYQGPYLNAFTYPNSIVAVPPPAPREPGAPLQLLVGNSADPGNRHFELLDAIKALDDGRLQVTCPLVYGDGRHARRVAAHGLALFGPRFTALRERIPYADYLQLLQRMDIACFGHDRQQGMGNVRALLGMGKKVFMRPGTTSWAHLQALGLTVFDLAELDLAPGFPESAANARIIAETYSEARYRQGLDALFAVPAGS